MLKTAYKFYNTDTDLDNEDLTDLAMLISAKQKALNASWSFLSKKEKSVLADDLIHLLFFSNKEIPFTKFPPKAIREFSQAEDMQKLKECCDSQIKQLREA